MENHRRVAADCIPKEIIQHIQSFMSGKLAAQTAILSKWWHSAWSTRPNLVFREDQFRTRADEEDHAEVRGSQPKDPLARATDGA